MKTFINSLLGQCFKDQQFRSIRQCLMTGLSCKVIWSKEKNPVEMSVPDQTNIIRYKMKERKTDVFTSEQDLKVLQKYLHCSISGTEMLTNVLVCIHLYGVFLWIIKLFCNDNHNVKWYEINPIPCLCLWTLWFQFQMYLTIL